MVAERHGTKRPGTGVRALAAVIALAMAATVVACDAAAPSVLATPAATATALPDLATLAPPTTLPTTAPTAPPTPSPLPPAAKADVHFLDQRYVPGSKLRSAAGQIVWSGGERTSSRIWRYVPGAAAPELVLALPRRGSTISDVVAGAAGYAFVEVNAIEYGLGGWRIWFVKGPGAQPVELDRGLAYGAGFPPSLAMDDRRIAWAAFDEPPSGDVSRLRAVSTDDLAAVTTLRETPVRDGLLWLPALTGDELWYAILHPDWERDGTGDEFHVEMLDLSATGSAPVRFEGTGNDFSPAVSETHVAWKTAIGDGAALNWGTVTVLDRVTTERRTIPVGNLDSPSVGPRFVAFEELTRSRLAVYDLARGEIVDLLPANLAGKVHVGGQSISGSLLTFFTQKPGGVPRIGWAVLPD